MVGGGVSELNLGQIQLNITQGNNFQQLRSDTFSSFCMGMRVMLVIINITIKLVHPEQLRSWTSFELEEDVLDTVDDKTMWEGGGRSALPPP